MLLALALALVGLAHQAQTPPVPPAPATSETPRGGQTSITLETLDGKLEARPAAGFECSDPRKLGAQIVHFDLTTRAPNFGLDAAEVELADGQRWIGRVIGRSAEEIEVRLAVDLALQTSIDDLRSIVFRGRLPVEWNGVLGPAKEGDRLFRSKGNALDVIDGAVEEFSAQGVRFHGTRVDSRLFEWGEIAALYVEGVGGGKAGEPAAAPDQVGVPVRVDLVQGSRLRGMLRSCAAGKVRLVVHAGVEIELPFSALRQLFVDDGRAQYLSDLPPADSEPSRPFGDDLGLSWPLRVDRSVTGRALTAGGRVWPHGIGVHAPGRTSWKLAPGWRALRGRVAIDDEVLQLTARGSVQFRVWLDGKQAWESTVVRGGDAPVEMPPIELGAAKELVLEVDSGPDSFIADRADWLGLLLVR